MFAGCGSRGRSRAGRSSPSTSPRCGRRSGGARTSCTARHRGRAAGRLRGAPASAPESRIAPVDARAARAGTRRSSVELLGVPRLDAVVELLPDRARELVDDGDGVDELERADALASESGELVHELEVGLDLTRRVRPLHLDDDPAPVRKRRTVHLSDRGGCDRRLLEVDVELLEGEPELVLDDLSGLLEREGRDRVLERLQLEDDVRRDDVRAGGEELAELDERRPSSSSISRRRWPRGEPSGSTSTSRPSRERTTDGPRVSNRYPNPCLAAIWAISDIRPSCRTGREVALCPSSSAASLPRREHQARVRTRPRPRPEALARARVALAPCDRGADAGVHCLEGH